VDAKIATKLVYKSAQMSDDFAPKRGRGFNGAEFTRNWPEWIKVTDRRTG
jgi:hypothetical protein